MKQTEKQEWLTLFVALSIGMLSGAILMYLLLNPPAPDIDYTQIKLARPNRCENGLVGFVIELNNSEERDFLFKQILNCKDWVCEANYTNVYCCRREEVCAGG